MLLAFSQPVNCIFRPKKTLNWLVAVSKLRKHRGTCCTAEWPYCPFAILWRLSVYVLLVISSLRITTVHQYSYRIKLENNISVKLSHYYIYHTLAIVTEAYNSVNPMQSQRTPMVQWGHIFQNLGFWIILSCHAIIQSPNKNGQ